MVAMTQMQAMQRSCLKVQRCSCQQPARTVGRIGVRIQAQQQAGREAQRVHLPVLVRPAALTALVNALAVLPAHADAGKIFDFNLTLPIMATQFLLLMVFLDKTWFTPVGEALDKRDADLREKLGSVRDNSGQLRELQEQAEKVLREARQEAQAMVADARGKAQEEQTRELEAAKAKIDKELEGALAALDGEMEGALQDMEAQVNKLSGEIIERVIPEQALDKLPQA